VRNSCDDGIPNSTRFQATRMTSFDWQNSHVKPARSSCNSWFNNLAGEIFKGKQYLINVGNIWKFILHLY